MPSTRKHSNALALLFFSIATLLVACSPTSQTPISTPTAHSTVESIPSHAAPPIATLIPDNGGGTGRIALACSSDSPHDKADICVSNLEGSAMQRLTGGPGPNISPAWSPDGKRIAFRAAGADVFEASDIWIMNADGSGQTNLTKDRQGNWGATWSPDGKHILFNSGRDGSIPLLYVINPDGSGVRRLCPNSHLWEEYPDWSPDGTKIAFMSNVGYSSWVIYVMNADGSQQTRLTTSLKDTSFNSPDWSPDGTRFLYMHSLPNGGEIWVMNANGSGQTKLMDAYGFGDGPVWQP